jgi:predicted component of type VI protein secretion system
VDVTKLPFAIGRHAGNDWVLSIDNKWGVSGKHAIITYKDGQYYIEDSQSTFGTLVNGEKIPPRVPTALNDPAEIGLGPMVKVQFQIGDAPLRSSERTAE